MITNQHGLEITADNEQAVGHFDRVVSEYLALGRETGAHLKAAFAADPDLLMAHCTRGYFFLLFATRAVEGKARQALEAARKSLAERGATQRERLHVAALDAWLREDWVGATALWEQILLDNPTDALALRLAHYTHFYAGETRQMRDSTARALYAWNESVPDFGFVCGMHAFGLEEDGYFADAEIWGRRAIELNSGDPWAVHAVTHVFEMTGRYREGIEWLKGLKGTWNQANNFRYHLWWHRCLFHLEIGQFNEALDLYDQEVRADTQSTDYLDIANATSLLWRLDDAGIDVGDRWHELADKAELRIGDHLLAFADAHYMLALAADRRDDAAERMLASMRVFGRRNTPTQAPVAAEVAVPLCQALLAASQGAYDRAVDLLLPVRYAVWRLGGSHAQRDLFAQILIQAALKSGRLTLARALLSERTAAKPNSPRSWLLYAETLDSLRDRETAKTARQNARRALSY
jgi:tetratricopeptide (TPR) repeat protein